METQGLASVGYLNFLFGIGLAAWAASNERSPLLWLAFGWLLAPVAGLLMLFLHCRALRTETKISVLPQTGRSDLLSVRKAVI